MFLNETVRYILIGVVTTAWIFNLAAPFIPGIREHYKPDPSVNAVFMIVIGAIFGSDAWGRVRGSRNGEQGPTRNQPREVDQGTDVAPEEGGAP